MPEHCLNQKTEQLLRVVVENYRRSRRAYIKSRVYSVCGGLRRTSPFQKTRDLEYTNLLVDEYLSQANIMDYITLTEYANRIPESARGFAAAASKTMAQRLKNRSDFLSTFGGLMAMFVTVITILQSLFPGTLPAPFPILFPFMVLAQFERHMVLEESILLEELHELFKVAPKQGCVE